MIREMVLPAVGETLDEAEILEWIVQEGEYIRKGQPVFIVQTDKVEMEVEAIQEGWLRRIIAPAGTVVPVTGTIALLSDEEDEPLPEDVEQPAAPQAEQVEARDEREKALEAVRESASTDGVAKEEQAVPETEDGYRQQEETQPPREKKFVSPRARRLAAERGVDLSQIEGSGPKGRVTEADVERFLLLTQLQKEGQIVVPTERAAEAAQPAPVEAPQRPVPAGLTGTRRAIAKRMSESHAIPHVTIHAMADCTELVAFRERLRALGSDPVPGYTDLLIKICAVALQRHPQLNATLDDKGLQQHEAVHISLAVDTERGLLVPVLRDVQALGLEAIGRQRRVLVEAALEGTVQAEQLQGGTFTLTNLGGYFLEGFTPLLNPPQVGILGVTQIGERPWVIKGELAVRPLLPLSLTFDHRAVDGRPAAAFLDTVRRLVEEPTRLLL